MTATNKSMQVYDWLYQVSRLATTRFLRQQVKPNPIVWESLPLYEKRDLPAAFGTTNRGSKITLSENHPDWGPSIRKNRVFSGDMGGPFQSQIKYATLVNPESQYLKGWYIANDSYFNAASYYGPFVVITPASVVVPSPGSMRNLAPLGSTAISRCKPTNHIADLSVFLAELYSDGLPKMFGSTLWKDNVDLARNAGEEYLNEEFGWKPLISDVSNIMYSVASARTLLEAYERGSGQIVRRRYEFPIEETTTDTSVGTNCTGPLTTSSQALAALKLPASAEARVRKITKTWRRTWFSGAFTYHLPSGYDSRNAIMRYGAQADALLGTDLTPDTLWNAMPWSWAIDWFSNAGDVISNLSDWSTDGLVLKYGYIMEHSVQKDLYYADKPHNYQSSGAYMSPVEVYVETKRRQAATPFGFELSWGGLSPRQLSIAAALGLTRR